MDGPFVIVDMRNRRWESTYPTEEQAWRDFHCVFPEDVFRTFAGKHRVIPLAQYRIETGLL